MSGPSGMPAVASSARLPRHHQEPAVWLTMCPRHPHTAPVPAHYVLKATCRVGKIRTGLSPAGNPGISAVLDFDPNTESNGLCTGHLRPVWPKLMETTPHQRFPDGGFRDAPDTDHRCRRTCQPELSTCTRMIIRTGRQGGSPFDVGRGVPVHTPTRSRGAGLPESVPGGNSTCARV